jgi:hypothetical protein
MTKICKQCKKEYTGRNTKYCCKHCLDLSMKIERHVTCSFCKKEIIKNYTPKKLSFCDMSCRTEYQKLHLFGHRFEKGKGHHNYKGVNKIKICKNCDQEFNTNWNKDKQFCSRECWRLFNVGENHPNYNPLVDRFNKKDSSIYKLWSFKIKELAKFKCIKCNSKKELNSHHIENWANNKKLRFDLKNGVCLCKECHINLHSIYGYKTNLTNLEDFLK